jgi:hypothetical protein
MLGETSTQLERENTMKRLLAGLALALLIASPVAASPSGSSSIVIDQSPVSFGDAVTFTTTYPHGTHNPWISVRCYQSGVLVYGEGNTSGSEFVLGGFGSQWDINHGGPADCTAELGDLYWHAGQEVYVFLATTSFAAV